MILYNALSKLISDGIELDQIQKKKNVQISEIQRVIRSFVDNLKNILKCQAQTEESNNFRIYTIKWLNNVISFCLKSCSNSEKNEIQYLWNKIQNNNKDIQNINNQNKDDKSRNKGNYYNNQNNYNKNYYNKQYMNNIDMLQNRNTIDNDNIMMNNIEPNKINQKNVKYNNKEDNFYLERIGNKKYRYNEIMKLQEDQEINQKYYNNTKYRKDMYKNNKINNGYNNNYQYKNNFNFTDKNFNNKKTKRQKTIKKYRNEKDLKANDYFNEKDYYNNKNNYNIINNIINENEKKECNSNSFKKKINSNSSKKNAQTPNKYEREIDKLYQELFKENISQYFINSIINKNNDYNFNRICPSVFTLVENSKQEYIEQVYKEKLTTLVCILFYFAKGQRPKINEGIFNSDSELDKKLFNYLQQNILLPNNTKVLEFNANKINFFTKNFCKNLLLENTPEGKYIIFSVYTFLIISRCLRKCSNQNDIKFFDDLLEKEYIISFKLHFILKHQEYYKAISDDFMEIYHGLNFINVFYTEIFCENSNNKLIMKDYTINKYIFGKNKFVLSFENNSNFDINVLFSKIDNEIYDEVMEKLGHFFSINEYDYNDINDLIYYSTNNLINKDSNFILNLVEHVCEKKKYIYNNFTKYKNNLISLEYEIFNYGKNALNKRQNTTFEKYSINEVQKNVFNSLLNKINEKINPKYKDKFELFPYGSITQFLGGSNSDIDIYLHIKNEKIKDDTEKINLIYALEKTIENIVKYAPRVVISKRLCVISFQYRSYKDHKQTDFDISLMGFCPYIHSTLLRSYSLMDPRFSLLAITLKRFIAIIKLKNYENKQDFLNSFSWVILLITFLQDIIKPQILPKILSYEKNYILKIPIPYGQYNEKNMIKNYNFFVQNIKEENTLVPECLNDDNLLKKIYKEKIQKKEKNNLSCAEIFLYFLEFIIYYFKCDSIYVNCSIENEGFEPMFYILNNDDIKKSKIDERFQEYFKYKYCKAKNFKTNKITKDGFILIRDPLDPHYNPAQTLRNGNYKIFLETLKNGYLNLLKNGDKIFHPVNYYKDQ